MSEIQILIVVGLVAAIGLSLLMYWFITIKNPELMGDKGGNNFDESAITVTNNQSIPQVAIDIIKKFEGFRSEPYLDAGGQPTIGYGETQGISHIETISEEQATGLLIMRLEQLKTQILKLVKVPLNDNQLSALLSFCYNLGIGSFQRSTLLRMINKKADNSVIATSFTMWNQVNGIKNEGIYNRRKQEYQLFVEEMD